MPRIFLLGATGYIGGDFLYRVAQTHPDWEIVCLVRNSSLGPRLSAAFPSVVRIVEGSLDSHDLIEREASLANIVVDCADCDHVLSAQAIARGLTGSDFETVYWIHTSGTGILTHQNFSRKKFGVALDSDVKVYDDWDNVAELTSLPDKALHRHVDKIVLAASADRPTKIRTAIVCPPAIFGVGRGLGNKRSVQVYLAAQLALMSGRGLQIENGSNLWHEVHIRDLSNLFLSLCEAAVNGGAPASWNEEGYYFAENGEFQWGKIIQAIADEAYHQGYLTSNFVQGLSFEEAQKIHKWFPYLCGTTSRGIAKRANKLLGWVPAEATLRDEIPAIVRQEAKSLGLHITKSSL